MIHNEITILNDLSELARLEVFMKSSASDWKLDKELAFQLNLVAEEVVANIILYGFPDKDEGDKIRLELNVSGAELKMKITDHGKEFNPLQVPPPDDLQKPAGERNIGGLGVYLIRQLMDKVEYERKDNENILILTKNILLPHVPELKP